MTVRRYVGALAVLFTLACSQAVFAAAYQGRAYEPFDYTANTQIVVGSALNGGFGFNASGDVSSPNLATSVWGDASALPAASGAATNPGKLITGTSLSYLATGYPSSTGNKGIMDAVLGTNTLNVSRNIGQLVDSGTFYFSYLTRLDSTTKRTNSFGLFGPANGTTGTPGNTPERVSIGQIGVANASPNTPGETNGNFGLLFNNSNPNTPPNGVVNAASPIAFTPNVVHLIVGRVDFNASGNDTFTMYVDPTDVSAEPVTPYIQTSAFELTSFNSFRLFAGTTATIDGVSNPPAQANFDEVRLGSTWAAVTTAVVPEPTTLVLAGLGALGLALAARRKLA
jgi:hypothetical protein